MARQLYHCFYNSQKGSLKIITSKDRTNFLFSFQKFQIWENGNTVSFQLYENNNFGQKELTLFVCKHFALEVTPFNYRKLPRQTKTRCVNLKHVISKTTRSLYPNCTSNQQCSMMLLSNLAEPEWIQINCTEKLLADVICVKRTDPLDVRKTNYQPMGIRMICPVNAISKGARCFLFLWHNINESTDLKLHCKLHNALSAQVLNIQYFQYLFDAIQSVFPPILSPHQTDKTKIHRFTYDKYISIYHYEDSVSPNGDGFNLCTSKKIPVVTGENMFKCKSDVFISYLFVCDGITDCPNLDNLDEQFCHCLFNEKIKGNLCKESVNYKDNKTICTTLYFSAKGSCHKYITTKYESKKLKKAKFLCSDNSTIDTVLKNDMVIDCKDSAKDEEILTSVLRYKQVRICRRPYEIPCKERYSKCFNISDICNYRVNFFGRVQPCSNSAHLQNCEYFECNMMFECVKAYCIPWAYVCDGKWDCPDGEDEMYAQICDETPICSHMFKCRGERRKCLHLGNSCDGITDCPQGDDEYLCELKYEKCPTKCVCLVLAIECSNLNYYYFASLSFPYIFVSVLFSNYYELINAISTRNEVKYLKLKHNGISQICYKIVSNSIMLLDSGYNYVQHLKRHCFLALSLLQSITLINNYITLVETDAFYELTGLKFLDLSNNFLTELSNNIIKGSFFFKIFVLKNVTVNHLDMKFLDGINSIIIDTDDYKLCCMVAPNLACTAAVPWYIYCNNSLPSSVMRWSFIFISTSIIVVNGFAIVFNSVVMLNKAYFLCIAAVHINDILNGAYFGIIWIFDVISEGEFILKEVY